MKLLKKEHGELEISRQSDLDFSLQELELSQRTQQDAIDRAVEQAQQESEIKLQAAKQQLAELKEKQSAASSVDRAAAAVGATKDTGPGQSRSALSQPAEPLAIAPAPASMARRPRPPAVHEARRVVVADYLDGAGQHPADADEPAPAGDDLVATRRELAAERSQRVAAEQALAEERAGRAEAVEAAEVET